MAIRSFADRASEDVALALSTKASQRALPSRLHNLARENLVLIDAAAALNDLAPWPSQRLENLKADRKGQHSIRINDQYRI